MACCQPVNKWAGLRWLLIQVPVLYGTSPSPPQWRRKICSKWSFCLMKCHSRECSEAYHTICNNSNCSNLPYPIHATERQVAPLQIWPVFVALKTRRWVLLNLLIMRKIPLALTNEAIYLREGRPLELQLVSNNCVYPKQSGNSQDSSRWFIHCKASPNKQYGQSSCCNPKYHTQLNVIKLSYRPNKPHEFQVANDAANSLMGIGINRRALVLWYSPALGLALH